MAEQPLWERIQNFAPQVVAHSEAEPSRPLIALGIEGSANKCGIGVLRFDAASGEYVILSNPRRTYITPPGSGFLPRETAWHHQAHVTALVRAALAAAGIAPRDVSVICYTKGPGMGAPLRACAVCARVQVEPRARPNDVDVKHMSSSTVQYTQIRDTTAKHARTGKRKVRK